MIVIIFISEDNISLDFLLNRILSDYRWFNNVW